MTIKVIGAGFGRTGTMSLKLALEQLGYTKCYHMLEVAQNAGHAEQWAALTERGEMDWDGIFEGYQASVDWPSAAFYQEQMAQYPDAKVVLTTRDPDKWYESCSNTIFAAMAMAREKAPDNAQMKMGYQLVMQNTLGGKAGDREHCKAVFETHNAEVQRIVPPEKLLVFEVAQGWSPLCSFLGVPVPEADFPRVNSTEEFRQMMQLAGGDE